MALLRSFVVLSMLLPSMALKVGADMQQGRKLVDSVFAEAEERCKQGDVNGATINMIKWFSKSLPKMSQEQSIRLMDACVLKNGGMGNAALNQWVQGCVAEKKDCKKPPAQLAQSLAQLGESKFRSKLKSGMKRVYGPYYENAGEKEHPEKSMDPDSRPIAAIEPPAVWTRGCFTCNLAANLAYACDPEQNDQHCLIKDDPIYGKLDFLLFDKLLPAAIKATEPDEKEEVPAAVLVDDDDVVFEEWRREYAIDDDEEFDEGAFKRWKKEFPEVVKKIQLSHKK